MNRLVVIAATWRKYSLLLPVGGLFGLYSFLGAEVKRPDKFLSGRYFNYEYSKVYSIIEEIVSAIFFISSGETLSFSLEKYISVSLLIGIR